MFLSRLAIPEMAAMLCELLAYLLLAGERPGRGRLVAAGVMTAAAVGMKATSAAGGLFLRAAGTGCGRSRPTASRAGAR